MSGATTELLAEARRRTSEIIKDIGELVSIETPSATPAALDAGLDWIRGRLHQLLGPADRETTRTDPELGTALVADYAGTGAGVVALLLHYDTVFDLGTTAQRPWSIDGDVGRGPGCVDMKGGIGQALWSIRIARDLGLPLPDLRMVITPDEELGSLASRPLIEAEVSGARAALVYEPAAAGALKTARSGLGLVDVEITGVASHAGSDPTAGASAIDELARVIRTLHSARDLAVGTSVNVGLVAGGTRRNVVADRASCGVDVRIKSPAEAARIDEVFASLRPADPRCTISVSGGWNRPAMERTPGTAALFELVRTLGREIGVELEEASVGGMSDANLVSALGIPVLDGLGAVGGGAHATDEWMDLSAVPVRTALSAALLNSLS